MLIYQIKYGGNYGELYYYGKLTKEEKLRLKHGFTTKSRNQETDRKRD
jgi:hypothetical protein